MPAYQPGLGAEFDVVADFRSVSRALAQADVCAGIRIYHESEDVVIVEQPIEAAVVSVASRCLSTRIEALVVGIHERLTLDLPVAVVGEEEKKMGIKGSSTVTFFYENCKVPVENVLGKVFLSSLTTSGSISYAYSCSGLTP